MIRDVIVSTVEVYICPIYRRHTHLPIVEGRPLMRFMELISVQDCYTLAHTSLCRCNMTDLP